VVEKIKLSEQREDFFGHRNPNGRRFVSASATKRKAVAYAAAFLFAVKLNRSIPEGYEPAGE